jgi:hypothetical protein
LLLLTTLLLLQVWAELLVLLAEGEMEAKPWDQERHRPHRSAALQDNTGGTAQQQQQGWQLLLQEYKGQEVLRRVVQVRGLFICLGSDVWGFGGLAMIWCCGAGLGFRDLAMVRWC